VAWEGSAPALLCFALFGGEAKRDPP
jgi:hypothetical protein